MWSPFIGLKSPAYRPDVETTHLNFNNQKIAAGPSGIHPYRLRGLEIARPNQVWCADITYIPMARGFMYLFCVMDWHSRKVLSWELSNTLDTDMCLRGLNKAVEAAGTVPEIFTPTRAASSPPGNGRDD